MFILPLVYWRKRERDLQNLVTTARNCYRREQADSVEKKDRGTQECFQELLRTKKKLTFERHKFFSRAQAKGESIDQYATELRTLASTCEFQDLRDGLVRDRIVG